MSANDLEPEGGIGSPSAAVTDGCEQPGVSAGN